MAISFVKQFVEVSIKPYFPKKQKKNGTFKTLLSKLTSFDIFQAI